MSADFFATITQTPMLPPGQSEDAPTVPAAPSNGGGYLGLLPEPSESEAPRHESENESEDSGTDTWLKSMLLRVGLLTTDQLSEALRAEAMTGKDFETIVVERGWIDRTELESLLETREAEAPVAPAVETESEPVDLPQVPLDLTHEPERAEPFAEPAPEPEPEQVDIFGPPPLPTIEFDPPPSHAPFEEAHEPAIVIPEIEPTLEPELEPFAGPEFPAFPEPFAEPFVEDAPEHDFISTSAVEPEFEPEPEPEPVAELETAPDVEFDAEPEPIVPTPVTPAITPEILIEPRTETAEVTVVHRVFARLSNGERVQVTSSSDRNAARSEAKALMAYLREASGDWPFLSARFVRPEAIISVDLETELL